MLKKMGYVHQPVENPNSIIEIDAEQFIIPGYMEHDPKAETIIARL